VGSNRKKNIIIFNNFIEIFQLKNVKWNISNSEKSCVCVRDGILLRRVAVRRPMLVELIAYFCFNNFTSLSIIGITLKSYHNNTIGNRKLFDTIVSCHCYYYYCELFERYTNTIRHTKINVLVSFFAQFIRNIIIWCN